LGLNIDYEIWHKLYDPEKKSDKEKGTLFELRKLLKNSWEPFSVTIEIYNLHSHRGSTAF